VRVISRAHVRLGLERDEHAIDRHASRRENPSRPRRTRVRTPAHRRELVENGGTSSAPRACDASVRMPPCVRQNGSTRSRRVAMAPAWSFIGRKAAARARTGTRPRARTQNPISACVVKSPSASAASSTERPCRPSGSVALEIDRGEHRHVRRRGRIHVNRGSMDATRAASSAYASPSGRGEATRPRGSDQCTLDRRARQRASREESRRSRCRFEGPRAPGSRETAAASSAGR